MKRHTFLFVSCLLVLTSCEINTGSGEEAADGSTKQISQAIKKDDAERVRTTISMRAGRLMVKGGADNLVDTDISSNREEWKPEIEYTLSGKTGRLRIEQPESEGLNFNFNDDYVNDWDILLNENIAQDLDVKIGAGETTLDLRGMMLNSVKIDAGVGEHNINLSGTSVPELRLNAGVGEVSVNLTGKWNNDLIAEFNGGIGELNLILPSDMGIRMQVSGALGSINAPALEKNGRVYTNDLYGDSEYMIELEVTAGIGEVNLSLE